jgi:hypothetical protein
MYLLLCQVLYIYVHIYIYIYNVNISYKSETYGSLNFMVEKRSDKNFKK